MDTDVGPLEQQFIATVMSSTSDTLAAPGSDSTGAGAGESVAVGMARYRLGRVIGEGGMGRVLEAEDLQFGRAVALKQMLGVAAEDDRTRRFGLEAVVTANLDHPGIPAVYERGHDDGGRPFYAMRLVRGRSLRDAIDQAETLDDRLRLLPALVDVAQTLAFAHARGVIHRDIKPDNVVVGGYGDTVVIDWGVAKLRGMSASYTGPASSPESSARAEAGGSLETQHGSVVGTPAYMAPEQAAGRIAEVDERSDVFSLGAMLYHLFAGHPPYRGRSSMAVIAKAIEGEHEPLASLGREVPSGIAAIVDKAMAKDPKQRYASAGELAEALQDELALGVRGRSRWVRIFADATSAVVTVFMLLVLAGILVTVPLANLGIFRFVLLALFGAGATMAVVEWSTLGRHGLSPLVLGLAVIVGFEGLVMNGMGRIEAFHALSLRVEGEAAFTPDAAAGLLRVGQILSEGEIVTYQLAAALIVLWAVARYRITRAERGGV
jgi:predicted Ser/Thr protein kinase